MISDIVCSIPICSASVCGALRDSTIADCTISAASFFSVAYCDFNSACCAHFNVAFTALSIAPSSSCTHFTRAEYASVPPSHARDNFPISVENIFFALNASCIESPFFVVSMKSFSTGAAAAFISTLFENILVASSIIEGFVVTVHFAHLTASQIFPHTSSSQFTTVCAVSSRVSIFHFIFPVRTILYKSFAFFSVFATTDIFCFGCIQLAFGEIALPASSFGSDVRHGAVIFSVMVEDGFGICTFLPSTNHSTVSPSIFDACFSSAGTIFSKFFVFSAHVAIVSPANLAHCASHSTDAADRFKAASATFGDAFTQRRFKAPSAVNHVSLMSCFVGSLCELYHSCAFANHSLARSFTTSGVIAEATGAATCSIPCDTTHSIGDVTALPAPISHSISGRPISVAFSPPCVIWYKFEPIHFAAHESHSPADFNHSVNAVAVFSPIPLSVEPTHGSGLASIGADLLNVPEFIPFFSASATLAFGMFFCFAYAMNDFIFS